MNSQQEREELDRKLAKLGYEHPAENNHHKNEYMSYSTDSKDVYTSTSHNTYSSFSTEEQPQQVQKPTICPKCDQMPLYFCPCKVGEMMCKDSHMWYVKKDGIVVSGDPHSDGYFEKIENDL